MLNNFRYSTFCSPFTHQLVLQIHLQSLHLLSTELHTWEYSIIKSVFPGIPSAVSIQNISSYSSFWWVWSLSAAFSKLHKNTIQNTAFQLSLNVAVSLNFKISSACNKIPHSNINMWRLGISHSSFSLVIFYKVLSNILCLKQTLLLFCVLWVIRCLAPSVGSTISAQFNLRMPFCTWKENGNKSVSGK